MSTERSVTAVVPTRNEADNMTELTNRMPACVHELIIVDDSDDDTADIARTLSAPFCVQVIHRLPQDRHGGLSGAVTEGFRRASTAWVVVIDGDLQHPPEVIADLVRRAEAGDVDVVVACRHGDEAWAAMSPFRRLLSSVAGRAAQVAFRRRLRTADPMSGFFMVRRSLIDIDILKADGFKILLEILITHPNLRVAEVPYVFGRRHHGESKGTIGEGLRYGRHLVGLWVRAGRVSRSAHAEASQKFTADAGTPLPRP